MFSRSAEAQIESALAHMRVVALVGARQTGKTTLVRQVAQRREPTAYHSLDTETLRRAAADDPTGFVAALRPLTVIDEVQRAPDLMLAIKQRVDENDEPGQFLLTGSANLSALGTIPDTLPGRAAYIRLRPLAQSEIEGTDPLLIDRLFAGEMPEVSVPEAGLAPYADRILHGGFPEALRLDDSQRRTFFNGYVESMVNREVDAVARVDSREALVRVLRLIAARSGGLLNVTAIGSDIGIDDKTARRYASILESLFLIERLPAWSRNLSKRQVKMPKSVVSDTGLLAHLNGTNRDRLTRPGAGPVAGVLVETFVANEIAKLNSFSSEPAAIFHLRDRDGREIDLILERADGSVVAIEVKASATVKPADFRHLDHLAGKAGAQLKASVVFHTGRTSVQFAAGKFALPLASLWAES